MQILVTLFVLIQGFYSYAERPTPSYLKICKRNDPQLSECWKESMVSLLPRLVKGIPEMGLRAIEPVLVPTLNLDFGGTQSMSFKATLRNLTLFGCSNLKVVDASTVYNDEGVVVKLNMTFPTLYMTSDFKAVGQVLLLKFDTVGKFVGNFSNTDVHGFWKSKNVLKNGKVHGVFEESFVKVKLGSIHVEFDRLMGDNEELNANINKIINENIDILYGELRPVVESVVNKLVTESINKVYDLFPMDVLYPV